MNRTRDYTTTANPDDANVTHGPRCEAIERHGAEVGPNAIQKELTIQENPFADIHPLLMDKYPGPKTRSHSRFLNLHRIGGGGGVGV